MSQKDPLTPKPSRQRRRIRRTTVKLSIEYTSDEEDTYSCSDIRSHLTPKKSPGRKDAKYSCGDIRSHLTPKKSPDRKEVMKDMKKRTPGTNSNRATDNVIDLVGSGDSVIDVQSDSDSDDSGTRRKRKKPKMAPVELSPRLQAGTSTVKAPPRMPNLPVKSPPPAIRPKLAAYKSASESSGKFQMMKIPTQSAAAPVAARPQQNSNDIIVLDSDSDDEEIRHQVKSEFIGKRDPNEDSESEEDAKPAVVAPLRISEHLVKWGVPDDESIEKTLERFKKHDEKGTSKEDQQTSRRNWSVPENESIEKIRELIQNRVQDMNRPLHYQEFMGLFRKCDRDLEEMALFEKQQEDGKDQDEDEDAFIDRLEHTSRSLVNSANKKMKKEDTTQQSKAQYGRILFPSMHVVMKQIMKLHDNQVFIDIGSGIGNACFQAAYTFGCEARGIEVDSERHLLAKELKKRLKKNYKNFVSLEDKRYSIGTVELKQGELQHPKHRDFITSADVAFCNNYAGNFGTKAAKLSQRTVLDDHLAGLFCLMKPGSVIVTLHPLPLFVPSQADSNEVRKRYNLKENKDSSFFDFEEFVLKGNERLFSWNSVYQPIKLFKYTRRRQRTDYASFLCCNPRCDNKNKPIRAWRDDGDHVLVNMCSCKFEPKLKSQRQKEISIYVAPIISVK